MKPKSLIPWRTRPKSNIEGVEELEIESQKRWYQRVWPWIAVTGLLLGWILLNGITALSNLEQFPSATRKSLNQYLSWYYDDAGWTGVWSSKAEGYVDYEELSPIDVRIEMKVEQGQIDGVISSPEICKTFPLFDFVLIEGMVSGDSIDAVAYDYIGGHRRDFVKVRLTKSDAGIMLVTPIDGIVGLLPASAKIRLHPDEGAFDEKMPHEKTEYCAAEREEFLKKMPGRPTANGKRQPIR